MGILTPFMIIGSNTDTASDHDSNAGAASDYDSEGWFTPNMNNGEAYVDNFVKQSAIKCWAYQPECDLERMKSVDKLKNHLNFDGSVDDDGCRYLDYIIKRFEYGLIHPVTRAGYDIDDYDHVPDLQFVDFVSEIMSNRIEHYDYDVLYYFNKAHEELRMFAHESWDASPHCWNYTK